MKNNIADPIDIAMIAISIFMLLSITACDSGNRLNAFNYGTESDSARYYYLNGFHEILDNGRWTESEKSFRKALDHDPDYILGKSLVGRITRNQEEREALLQELQTVRSDASDDVTLLLDVYLLNIESHKDRRETAETNFRQFVHKYPEDDYVKAEYIEILHSLYGSEAALDSLKSLATERQMGLGTYISSAASMELELGDIQKALALSENLEKLMLDSTYTSYKKLRAEIYLAQDSLEKAKELVDQVVMVEPNHIIALGMQNAINNRLQEN